MSIRGWQCLCGRGWQCVCVCVRACVCVRCPGVRQKQCFCQGQQASQRLGHALPACPAGAHAARPAALVRLPITTAASCGLPCSLDSMHTLTAQCQAGEACVQVGLNGPRVLSKERSSNAASTGSTGETEHRRKRAKEHPSSRCGECRVVGSCFHPAWVYHIPYTIYQASAHRSTHHLAANHGAPTYWSRSCKPVTSGAPSHTTRSAFSPWKCEITCAGESKYPEPGMHARLGVRVCLCVYLC